MRPQRRNRNRRVEEPAPAPGFLGVEGGGREEGGGIGGHGPVHLHPVEGRHREEQDEQRHREQRAQPHGRIAPSQSRDGPGGDENEEQDGRNDEGLQAEEAPREYRFEVHLRAALRELEGEAGPSVASVPRHHRREERGGERDPGVRPGGREKAAAPRVENQREEDLRGEEEPGVLAEAGHADGEPGGDEPRPSPALQGPHREVQSGHPPGDEGAVRRDDGLPEREERRDEEHRGGKECHPRTEEAASGEEEEEAEHARPERRGEADGSLAVSKKQREGPDGPRRRGWVVEVRKGGVSRVLPVVGFLRRKGDEPRVRDVQEGRECEEQEGGERRGDGGSRGAHRGHQTRRTGWRSSRTTSPSLKTRTVPVVWETVTATERVTALIAAADRWRDPRPIGMRTLSEPPCR